MYKDLIMQTFFQKTLNFTFTVRLPQDGTYGARKADGSWSGLVNELIQKRADIGNHLVYHCRFGLMIN